MREARMLHLDLDITRLLWALTRSAPTGIDRVEHKSLRSLLQMQDVNLRGVIVTPLGPLFVSRHTLQVLMQMAQTRWRGSHQDPVGVSLQTVLAAPPDRLRTTCWHVRRHAWQRLAHGLRGALHAAWHVLHDRQVWRLGPHTDTQSRVFYTASHWQLQHARRFAWLRRTHPPTPAVAFVHDVIPIDHPAFCGVGAAARHCARLRTLARHFCGLIVNSKTTEAALVRVGAQMGLTLPPIHVALLGVSDLAPSPAGLASRQPYFVCLGTLEPRKNIGFLLAVWTELVSQLGSKTPRLVLVGRRGWDCEDVTRVLARSSHLAPYVMAVEDLGDEACRSLLAGARGLVSPSLVEGFNLPLVEAQALGVPVVASDIPAHREVLDETHVQFVHPLDGPGWVAAILALGQPPHGPISPCQPRTWNTHAAQVANVLRGVAAKPPRAS